MHVEVRGQLRRVCSLLCVNPVIKFRSSGLAASTFIYGAISPKFEFLFLFKCARVYITLTWTYWQLMQKWLNHCHEVRSIYWPITRNRVSGRSRVTWANNSQEGCRRSKGEARPRVCSSVFLWEPKGFRIGNFYSSRPYINL